MAAALVAATTGSAGASAVPGAGVPGAAAVVAVHFFLYLPGDDRVPDVRLSVLEGGSVELVNADTAGEHTITSNEVDRSGRPLFDSDRVLPGEAGTVRGVSRLTPGPHPFRCMVHPDVMRGTLHITESPLGTSP